MIVFEGMVSRGRALLGGRAERRFERVRSRGSPRAMRRAAAKLIYLGRFDDADAILESGLALSPDHPGLLTQYAFSAHNSGRYQEGVTRWERVRALRPDFPMAWCGVAANARAQNLTDEAWAVMEEALICFPDDLNVISEAARVADHRGDPATAIVLWKRMRDRRRAHPEWLRAYANALVLLGRFDEAEAELDRAARRYPDHRGIFATKGLLAMAREDWDGALAIWQVYRTQYPDDETGWFQLGWTLTSKHLAEDDEEDSGTHVDVPANVGRVEDDAVRAMLLGFESLGDDCEFGIVQRRYGAEPLGLLRWNTVFFRNLMDALVARFDEVGSADTTRIESVNGEYYVTDRRWGLPMHTFISPTLVDARTLFPKMCRRIVYLKDKLIADLQAGEKIFVYKSQEIRLDELRVLHAELQTYGPVRLLCIKQANSDARLAPLCGEAGEVLVIEQDLYVGFIDRLGCIKGYWDIAFDDWIRICRDVDRAPALTREAGGRV